MKILVTGASGFVAKALIGRLLRDGAAVAALTRSASGSLPPVPGALEVHETDIADAAVLKALVIEGKVDAVAHLAASLDYFGDYKNLFRVNAGGTANLLDWSLRNGVKKFVFISSVEAMGAVAEDGIPADETLPAAPLSPYGRSKLEAETLVAGFAGEKIVLRLGNVYGPPSSALIVPLADAVLNQGKLLKLLPGYGERRVHPVFINDAVEGIVKALKPGAPGGVYIIAGEKHVTITELFDCVAGGLGARPLPGPSGAAFAAAYLRLHGWLCRLRKRADLPAYFTAGSGGRVHRAYSVEKARHELGYVPQVSLEDGVRLTLEWAKNGGILPS